MENAVSDNRACKYYSITFLSFKMQSAISDLSNEALTKSETALDKIELCAEWRKIQDFM